MNRNREVAGSWSDISLWQHWPSMITLASELRFTGAGRSDGAPATAVEMQGIYSAVIFALRTTVPHLTSSDLMKAPNSSGVLDLGSAPSAASRSRTKDSR